VRLNKIDPDGHILSGEELVARAAALVPALRARARGAEEAGRIPDETIDDVRDAGLFRAVVPRRYGGYEVDFKYVPQIFRELGRGCTSTAWTLGFLIYHNFQFGHFPEQAQDDVWGDKGYTMAPGQVMPSGSAEPVDGGYRLSGRWGYATGILHGDWMLLSAPLAGSNDPPDLRRFFVPVSECTVLDTWHVSAMRATGSHDVELDGVFVPEHHQINVNDLRGGTAPGLQVNTGALWQVPLLTFMVFGAVGPMLGAAEATFEIVADILKNKIGAYTGARLQQQMSTRIRLARNKLLLDATRGLFDAKIDEVSQTVAHGETLGLEKRAEMRAVVGYVARTSQTIVNELARDAGSRATFLDSPIQRFQRDVNSLATHAIFDLDSTANLYGGVLMGQAVPAGAMI
jgi:3-hydroxy-9,10-secoandrosta-1,3,5(10)-triene-9,17-dione monooxygenase